MRELIIWISMNVFRIIIIGLMAGSSIFCFSVAFYIITETNGKELYAASVFFIGLYNFHIFKDMVNNK